METISQTLQEKFADLKARMQANKEEAAKIAEELKQLDTYEAELARREAYALRAEGSITDAELSQRLNALKLPGNNSNGGGNKGRPINGERLHNGGIAAFVGKLDEVGLLPYTGKLADLKRKLGESLGKDISGVDNIAAIAAEYGFQLGTITSHGNKVVFAETARQAGYIWSMDSEKNIHVRRAEQ